MYANGSVSRISACSLRIGINNTLSVLHNWNSFMLKVWEEWCTCFTQSSPRSSARFNTQLTKPILPHGGKTNHVQQRLKLALTTNAAPLASYVRTICRRSQSRLGAPSTPLLLTNQADSAEGVNSVSCKIHHRRLASSHSEDFLTLFLIFSLLHTNNAPFLRRSTCVILNSSPSSASQATAVQIR